MLKFTTETITANSNQLLQGTHSLTGGVQDSNYGYYSGGTFAPPTRTCVINRLDFTTETLSANPGQLSQNRSTPAGTSSYSYGYIAGGETPPSSTIDRLDFASGTVSVPSQKLTLARYALAAVSNG